MPNLFSAAARLVHTSRCRGRAQSSTLQKPVFVAAARPVERALPIEPLEARTHLSVTQDSNGWTTVTPEATSRVIYVSNSEGSDANSGRTIDNPVKSLGKATSLLRDNSSDQILLKRGDVWKNQSFEGWWRSGKSDENPMVIGAYGDGARPEIDSGTADGFSAGKNGEEDINHVAIIGVHFAANTRIPGKDFVSTSGGDAGIRMLAPGDDFLIEDCYIEGYGTNVLVQDFFGPLSNVRVRRSVMVDAYSTRAHAQGLYAEGVHGLLLEGNLFDHNGWNSEIDGAGATSFNHNVYLRADNKDVVVRGNIFARAASHGLQARSGGIIEDNLFLDNPVGMSFGLVNGSPATAGGISGIVNGNVFLGGNSGKINGTTRGWGIEIGNTKPDAGTTVSNNIFSGDGTGGEQPAITIGVGNNLDNRSETVGVNDLTIRGNVVYKWPGGIRLNHDLEPDSTGPNALNGLVVKDNEFQRLAGDAVFHDMSFDDAAEQWADNVYDGGSDGRPDIYAMSFDSFRGKIESSAKISKVKYLEPDRNADSYDKSLNGEGTVEHFLGEVRKQSSSSWRGEYTAQAAINYVHNGFATSVPAPTPAPTEPAPAAGDPPANNPEVAPAPHDWSAPSTPVATASLTEEVQVARGASAFTFEVTYVDPTGSPIDAATVDAADLHLVGPKKFDQPATPVSTVANPDTGGLTVTYSVATPTGTWQRGNIGAYKLSMNGDQIRNAGGFAVTAGDLANVKVSIVKAPPVDKAPAVKRLKVDARDAASVTLTFSEDVGASIDAGDLFLVAEDGSRLVAPEQQAVVYDAARKTATFTFPGLEGAALPAGSKFRVVLSASGVTDSIGQTLAGDRTGTAGVDYASVKLFTA